MPYSSRRRFLSMCLAGSIGGVIRTRSHADVEDASAIFPGLEPIGRVEPRAGKAVGASPFSVGFETLDRRMFDPERTYDHLFRLGVKWARVQTGWSRSEEEPCLFDFGWLDDVVDRLHGNGVQPWFNLGYGNRLYSPEAPDAAAVGWVPLGEPSREKAWLRYVRKMADHYAERVRHWEIWNEPNITHFWKPAKPNPAEYVRLVRMTAPEIRKRVPDAVIIGGALAGISRDFLRESLEAGLGGLVDRISYHPYRAIPEKRYDEDVGHMRRLLAEHAPQVRLWQGENGCPSTAGSAGALRQFAWDEARQAKWLLRRIMTDLRLEIELTSYFHLVDLVQYKPEAGATGRANTKGLLRGGDYTPKPSYFAYQCLCALIDAETKKVELRADIRTDREEVKRISADEIHQVIFERKGKAMLAYWYPADLFEDFTMRQVEMQIQLPEDLSLTDPVLIDPLAVRMYRVKRREEAGTIFRRLPLTDYPLILAEREVCISRNRPG